MKEIEALSDVELRDALKQFNVNVGPITGTTRTIYEKRLAKLTKGNVKQPVTGPATIKRAASKSPSRTAPRTSKKKSNKSESEDEIESDEDQIISPRPHVGKNSKAKPVSSTPTKNRTPSPVADRSLNSSFRPANNIIPGRRTGLPAVQQSGSPVRSKNMSYFFDGDMPGATPPRNKVGLPRPHPVPTPPSLMKMKRTPVPSSGGNSFYDVGNTTGEEDSDDGAMETSRVVFDSKNEGKERRSPLRKAWDRLLGKDFKAGAVPGSSYEFRHGTTRTKVDRDPVTGRPRVKHSTSRDVSTVLMIVLSVFFVLLAMAYVTTAQREAVLATANVVSGSIRDTFTFFYKYAVLPVMLVGCAALVCVAIFFAHRWYKDLKLKEVEQFEALVEQILDLVRESSEEGDDYISIPHVRDVIFPPAKRRGSELARWEKAVTFLNENESRIATETRVLRGQECAVWKWLPYKKSGWQGNAFTSNSTLSARGRPVSPNVPEEALTRCLKIREVFEDRSEKDAEEDIDYDALELSLREKLYPVDAVHIAFDKSSKEGVVFMKLRDRIDAKKAFSALHGCWFNGHLVSVKYMRDRRYAERFPSTAAL